MLLPFLNNATRNCIDLLKDTAGIESRSYDTKSLQDANRSLKSMADFALQAADNNAQAMHIALYHVGETLQKASLKNNPWRKPAGSPNGTGGEFDFSPDNGGAGHTGSGGGTRSPAPSGSRIDTPATKPASGRKPRPEYKPGISPVSREDWNTIQDVLENHPSMDPTKTEVYKNVWAAEGGLKKDPDGSAVAGIMQSTLDEARKNPKLTDKLKDIKTPSDLQKYPEYIPDIYDVYLNSRLKEIGGSDGLAKVGNTYAAAAMADTVFRDGRASAAKLMREAIGKIDPKAKNELDALDGKVIVGKTFEKYGEYAQKPDTVGTLLYELGQARKRARPGEDGRYDFFKFEKELQQSGKSQCIRIY